MSNFFSLMARSHLHCAGIVRKWIVPAGVAYKYSWVFMQPQAGIVSSN